MNNGLSPKKTKSNPIYHLEVLGVLFAMCMLAGASPAFAGIIDFNTPLSYSVLDNYSAINAFVATADRDPVTGEVVLEYDDEFQLLDRGGNSTSVNETISLSGAAGTLDTTQSGSLNINPDAGTARLIGQHTVTSLVKGGAFRIHRSEGKHVLLAEFVVPDFGNTFTDIAFAFDFISSTDGQVLFRYEGDGLGEFSDISFEPNEYTSWAGINADFDDQIISHQFLAGDQISFAIGIEPGTGFITCCPNSEPIERDLHFTQSDAVNVSFSLLAAAPIAVPTPTSPLLLATGFVGLGLLSWLRKIELTGMHI